MFRIDSESCPSGGRPTEYEALHQALDGSEELAAKMLRDAMYWLMAAALVAVFAMESTPAYAQELTWKSDWQRFGPAHAAATGVAASAALGTEFFWDEPDSASWTGPILVDDLVRNAFFLDTERRRDVASRVSDVLLYGMLAMPTVVDPGVAWIGRDSPDVAGQMAAISLQSTAITYMTVNVLKHAVARRRPGFGDCYDDDSERERCEKRSKLSFPSGHTATAWVSAGLMCVMHEKIDIYRDATWNRVPCIAGLSGATAMAYLRIASNNHFLTDTLAGALIGFSAGYILPRALFFGFGSSSSAESSSDQSLHPTRRRTLPQTRGLRFVFRF